MSDQLAYVIVTPYTLHKSRTGGVLSRLMSRTGLDLAAARMFAPSPELVREYSNVVVNASGTQDRRIQEYIKDYILNHFMPDHRTGRRRRVMVLLFRGDEAVRRVRSVIGNFRYDRLVGETIRDTYGDLIVDENGKLLYFEPAVLTAPSVEETELKLKLWTKYSETDGGVLHDVIDYSQESEPAQRTLVLIKPDNFRFPTGRPGNVIDFFSRTGLYIVGLKVLNMSVSEACDFYGPVRDVLRTKLKDTAGIRAAELIEKEMGFKVPPAEAQRIGEILGPVQGDWQFENILKFMTGRRPSECDEVTQKLPGTEKCLALIYEGVKAVQKIRDVLGPTDPSKAPPGSIRREFGSTIMVNAAHASDSPESAERELEIVNVGENNFRATVESFYGCG
jgi:nucleoside diphosphate kinase